jgi:hypothetical protein
VTLQVFTARINSRDPDRLDITRKSGGVEGRPFAPSWTILRPALDARRHADLVRKAALDFGGDDPDADTDAIHFAEVDEAAAWERYVPAYTAEMRESYRANRPAWDALLGRERAVLVCYCTDPARCHRALLAGILGKLGADVRGEVPR